MKLNKISKNIIAVISLLLMTIILYYFLGDNQKKQNKISKVKSEKVVKNTDTFYMSNRKLEYKLEAPEKIGVLISYNKIKDISEYSMEYIKRKLIYIAFRKFLEARKIDDTRSKIITIKNFTIVFFYEDSIWRFGKTFKDLINNYNSHQVYYVVGTRGYKNLGSKISWKLEE